jgi:hypothetical protein
MSNFAPPWHRLLVLTASTSGMGRQLPVKQGSDFSRTATYYARLTGRIRSGGNIDLGKKPFTSMSRRQKLHVKIKQ